MGLCKTGFIGENMENLFVPLSEDLSVVPLPDSAASIFT